MPRERKYESPIEAMLGDCLTRYGIQFVLQEPIGKYSADIYVPDYKLVIECDGAQHVLQQDHDHKRDAFMRGLGYTIMRFTGTAINDDPWGCAKTVLDMVENMKYSRPISQATHFWPHDGGCAPERYCRIHHAWEDVEKQAFCEQQNPADYPSRFEFDPAEDIEDLKVYD